MPRVVYERNRLSSEDVPVIIEKMLALTNEHDFDGMVFEIPVTAGTLDMLQQMGRAFRAADKLLILVLSRSTNEVSAELLVIVSSGGGSVLADGRAVLVDSVGRVTCDARAFR